MSDQARLAEFQERLGVRFGRQALLEEALTHPSYANECGDDRVVHNQRLEFLGDAVLSLIVARWLFEHLPDAPEGELTSLRARLVRTESLAAIAQQIGLGDYMRFGHGEEASGGRQKPANLCAAFEALVGALYIDQGLPAVEHWFEPMIERELQSIQRSRVIKDAKSALQEYTQATYHLTPRYELVSAEGPDHDRHFTVRVMVDDECWGMGDGHNKQVAEQAAARQALQAHRP
ncbi:MAG: ribonuclease III [Anaerolineales bacterium]